MMRSMFSGVSGLRAHQSRMDVIGNNIANVNTVGFKSSRVTFQEVFSQTLKGASAPDSATSRSGTNPMQVGLGTSVASVDTIMTNGSSQRTDNPLDVSIDGDGFFVVKGSSADTYKFTRAGNFAIDQNGNLNVNGMSVYGWDSKNATQNEDGSYTFNTENSIEPLNLAGDKLMIGAKATTKLNLAGNLDASKASGGTFSVPMYVYDSLGNKEEVDVTFSKAAPVSSSGEIYSQWTWRLQPASGSEYTSVVLSGTSGTAVSGTILFDDDGNYASGGTVDITLVPDKNTTAAADQTITFDFSELSQWAADDSAKTTSVDGSSTGTFASLSVGSDGIITGIYSNGQQKPLGLIAVATFRNPAGLVKVGNNLFEPSTNSGDFDKPVKAGTNGAGILNPGTLEMSNVDLSREFTDMIITERGFQANSRIITTSDEMLQELVNLKR